jgi:glycosyltransferase involved in cell wall biosynthesis
MRVTAITASMIPSTTANSMQVMKVCQGLLENNHEVVLLAPDLGQELFENEESLKEFYGLRKSLSIQWLPCSSRLGKYDFAWRAVRQAVRLEGDVIYCWPIQAALFALRTKKQVVLELHGPPEGRLGPLLFQWLLKLPGRKRFLFITNALKRIVERQFATVFTAENAIIAPNGVDLQDYQALPSPVQSRQAAGLDDRYTAVYTGHLYPGRGMGLLVGLAKRFPQTQFVWIGGNPKDIRFWQDRLEQDKILNIKLLGFVSNQQIPAYQSTADVLLMPYEKVIAGSSGGNSADYCSPMKMFEYMASQRPVMASDLPVIREVLNESNAVLCPPEDLEAWTLAFESLMADPSRRRLLAERAWQEVQSLSWSARAAKALYGLGIEP